MNSLGTRFSRNVFEAVQKTRSTCFIGSKTTRRIVVLIGTLSIDDGNRNGDGETEERLRRGRGCVAKLEAVKQAQYDDNFPRLRIKYDVFVKRSQKSILIMK